MADIETAHTSLNRVSALINTVFAGEAPDDVVESLYQWKMWEARKQNSLILHWTGNPAERPALKRLPRHDFSELPAGVIFPQTIEAAALLGRDELQALLHAYGQPTNGEPQALLFRFVSYITTNQYQ
ncbi:uncharacterized protein FOMMEDRAFT_143301 [Fomitiporia mediterranea MF3/22]|uniref:uncharacterized protein n=1 Tax=Fomitiporia mediterranea (strain MF3/22) TaxID=694068 RepID=UPI0004407B73|nr:uncharacterized protein FOMMEDRAFT_143301 [Fomitiporia mediterranea MF3/22]EJC98202.1 hypothetical protein FOMMEDRAFT_143301 [Fomitiporia mediterranea MF3/22]